MTQDREKRKEQARAEINRLTPQVVRIARRFIQCVTVPNREENAEGEAALADAIYDFLEAVSESKLL